MYIALTLLAAVLGVAAVYDARGHTRTPIRPLLLMIAALLAACFGGLLDPTDPWTTA